MRRLAGVDWLLIGTFMPIFLFGMVMTVVHGVRGDFVRLPFVVSSAPDEQSYPIVRRVVSSPGEGDDSVAVGDRVLRLEGSDLRGMSWAGLVLRWSAAAETAQSLSFTIERAGVRSDVSVPLFAGYRWPGCPWWAPFPLLFTLVGAGLTLLVRATHWHLARRFYVAALLFAILYTPYFGSPPAPGIEIARGVLLLPLAWGLVFWNAVLFIPNLLRWGPRQRAVVGAFMLLFSAAYVATYWLPDAGVASVLMRSTAFVEIGFFIAVVVALTQVYRRCEPLGRRQVKWVVYGFYVGTLPAVLFNAFSALAIVPEWIGELYAIPIFVAVAIPLGFLVAIAFYDFLDIDRIFSATLSYSLLAIIGIAIVLGVMPTASHAASAALGLEPAGGQLLVALGLAAVVVPAYRIVQPRIDRLFFPQSVALEQGFAQLLTEIASCADAQALTQLIGDRLDALLRPASAVSYARSGDDYTPIAVRGRTAPPAFAANTTLIATLRERTTPFAAERWTARNAASVSPFERAALETLDAAVLMPIRRGPDLLAFACLGPKRSGDIYTPTDLAWLGAVAGKISDRLLSLDASAIAEQARAMHEALRRYVPSAVAHRIDSGKDVEAGERDVTVVFVDIRGYTGFSEKRDAKEIFGTVNQYTEAVSTLVEARRGAVVEFSGDGVLAVFGAPDEIPMKEQAAVEAARAIVEAVAALPGPGGGTGPGLSVGVGIATGPAFVGTIKSADRFIWTVIGNTTNLAARLQTLTRDLDAAVAIDATTRARAGSACADFVRHGNLPIRGRSRHEDVYVLPLKN